MSRPKAPLQTPVRCHASWVALIATLLLISGCAAQLDISEPFAGIQSLIPADDAESTPPARLFVIHGMTDHQIDYADSLVASLASGLSLAESARRDIQKEVPGAVAVDGRPASVNLRTYELTRSGKVRIRVMALTWSPLTSSIKRSRFSVDNAVSRVAINGHVKREVINGGMGDAVLYVGAYQPVMRRAVMMSLCIFLDGELVDGKCSAPAASNAPVGFISASLGSVMLFDAIEELTRSEAAGPVRAALIRTRLFYMFANQLPLLDLATFRPLDAPAPAQPGQDLFGGRLQRFLRQASPPTPAGSPGMEQRSPLHVVAFTDPNDLLSYRLQQSDAPGASLTNVSYPVAFRWFGLFADPLVAHTGYERDPQVLKLVTCGSAGCR